jgi:Aspartyl protease/PDZ domain
MRRMIFAAALVALITPAFAQSVDSVIAANKAAVGGAAWDAKQSMTVDFDYSGQGMTGTAHSVTDLTTPRFADSFAIGPATGANGYDGNRAWDQDPSGQVTYQDGGEQRSTAINEAYRRSNMLWHPDHGGAQISLATKTEDGHRYDVLTIVPKDGKTFDMWIDARTHMVARIVEKQGTDVTTTTLSDYRAVDGVQVAYKIVNSNGNVKYDSTLAVTEVAFGGALPASTFAIPTVTKMDFSIAGGAHQTTVPFHLINNHIYTDVWLNGKGPYRLLVDTGGVNIVTPTVAKELGLSVQGQMEGRGAGEGTMDTGLTKVAEVRVGDAVIKDQVFAVLPFESFADVEGVPENGLIGYEVFRRFIARVDYGKSDLTLIDPAHFDPAKAGVEVPFVFTAHIPTVQAEIDGLTGEFQIDTGARSELTLTDPFSVAHNLRAAHPKGVDAVTGWGVGGASRGYVTVLGALKVGGVTFTAPVTTLANEKRGAFGEGSFAGNIGGGLLKQYVVTFDYGHQKMYFAAGGIAERDGYDRAGMWLNRSGDNFTVMDVTATAPAAVAGIKIGDRIVTVDGKPAKDVLLPDLRKRLRSDARGTVVHFGVQRGSEIKDVAVTLRDLI